MIGSAVLGKAGRGRNPAPALSRTDMHGAHSPALMRPVLRQPVGDRVWFAGKARSADDWATVAGAHNSGQEVAGRVADVVR